MDHWCHAYLLTRLGKHMIFLLQGQTPHSEEILLQLVHWLFASFHCQPWTIKKKKRGEGKKKAVTHFCELSKSEHIAALHPVINLFKTYKRRITLKCLTLTYANSHSSGIPLLYKKVWIPHCLPACLGLNICTLLHTASLHLEPWPPIWLVPKELLSCPAKPTWAPKGLV